MKKAFITGATGFLGLNLVEQLQDKGWEIHVMHLPGEDLSYLSRFKVRTCQGNILNPMALQAAIPKGVDAVFHMAGDTSTWSKNNARQMEINVGGTVNVLRAAMSAGTKRFVYTSSISAFGFHDKAISEATPSRAKESKITYHISKHISEQEVRKISSGIQTVILNPCNVIGPYDQKNWAQTILTVYQGSLPGYPPGLGTFAHVRDVVSAHIAAAEIDNPLGQYVIGGTPTQFEKVFAVIESILGRPHDGKVISKGKLALATQLFKIKSWFDHKEPLVTREKYMRLVGTQLCDDRLAIRDLGLKHAPLEEMFNDSYQWLLRENLLHA